jgi:hypothetical protein
MCRRLDQAPPEKSDSKKRKEYLMKNMMSIQRVGMWEDSTCTHPVIGAGSGCGISTIEYPLVSLRNSANMARTQNEFCQQKTIQKQRIHCVLSN